MHGVRGVPAVVLVALLSACADPAGPLAPLQVALIVSSGSPVAGDRADVAIVVWNDGPAPARFTAMGPCAAGFRIERRGWSDDAWRRRVNHREVSCQRDADHRTVAPRDSLAFLVPWRPEEPGDYVLRPYVETEDGEARGSATRITVVPGALARLIHTHPDLPAVDLVVRDRTVAAHVEPGQVSPGEIVPAGAQRVELRAAGGGAMVGATTVTFLEGVAHTLVIRGGPTAPAVWDVTGTTALTDSGHCALRVIHLAANTPPIAVSVGDAGSSTPAWRIVPFPYGTASPYLQRTAGSWRVLVTAANEADTLLHLASLPIAGGEVRLLLLVDGVLGGVSPYLIDPAYRRPFIVEGEPT
jgi:hypothetical protein